jgi:hypothetical protein
LSINPDRLGLGTKQIEQRLRRILACIQGALKVAFFSYVGFSATQKTGQKTSNIVQVIAFAILIYIANHMNLLETLNPPLAFHPRKGIVP